ncbi:hypothetical protein ACQEWB_32670 [Streptomyces sp. CA-249302]|uniref:hypothetical protein n=1 Tax=Streptomyces sp. CA-249302 TaxID=3240058 RepID=UPI003D94260E
MTEETASSDEESTPQNPEANRVTENSSSKAERRHSGLSAWGTLFTGLAALMTVFTAAATSYTAFITYQDQQEQEIKNEEVAAANFAQRVEFIPGASGSMTLDNPNVFPISNVVLSVALYDSGRKASQQYFLLSTHSVLLPACSRITIPESDKWGTDFFATRKGQVAYFEDRSGQAWYSQGSETFKKSIPVRWDVSRSGKAPVYAFGIQFNTVLTNDMRSSISKSPRCK